MKAFFLNIYMTRFHFKIDERCLLKHVDMNNQWVAGGQVECA